LWCAIGDAKLDKPLPAPGATLPVHKHPYPRYGYVLTGRLCVTNMETGQSDIYEPGDFILESVGQWHKACSHA
jgi:quercetin dioxygenase-like cupin family protein